MLVLHEITTHLNFYRVVVWSGRFKAFNGSLLLVSHDRFFMKSVTEGDTSLVEEDQASSEGEQEVELHRSLYLLKTGRLTLLEDVVSEFEESLEKRAAKLSL